MSISTALENARNKIAACYTAISGKGGTLPTTQNLANMPAAINSIAIGSREIARYVLDASGNATTITGELNLDDIVTIGASGLSGAFQNCTGLTGVSFPALTSVGNSGLYSAFMSCYGLIGSVSFPLLTSIGENGLAYIFRFCGSGLTDVSFPSLTTVGNYGFIYAFDNCPGITELHFRADAQTVIKSQANYGNKFGATNATIYFDL